MANASDIQLAPVTHRPAYKEQGGVLVALIPRCGTHSIASALRGETVFLDQSEPYTTRLAFLRHPMERLASAYSFFFWMKEEYPKRPSPDVSSYEAFVDYALSVFDPHWQPYTEMFPNITQAYRLSDIHNVWRDYFSGGRRPGQLNSFEPKQITDYRRDELTERYLGDLELWHSL